jgi:hypothetical protein
MTNWELREFHLQADLPSLIQQVRIPIRRVIPPIQGHLNSICQVVPLITHIWLYPPHRSHLHPPSFTFPSTTILSLQNTKLSHSSLSHHVMIMSWHRVCHTPSTAFIKYSIHRVQHAPRTVYTEYSTHRVQLPSNIVCLPFILMITSGLRSVAPASRAPLHESSKMMSPGYIPTVASYLPAEKSLTTWCAMHRLPPSTRPNLLDYSMQVHLQTRSITASKCIFKLAPLLCPSASPNSLDHGIQVHLQSGSITASWWISKLARLRSLGASPNSLDHSLQVYPQSRAITASKHISKMA